jgi:hypothetical protein
MGVALTDFVTAMQDVAADIDEIGIIAERRGPGDAIATVPRSHLLVQNMLDLYA